MDSGVSPLTLNASARFSKSGFCARLRLLPATMAPPAGMPTVNEISDRLHGLFGSIGNGKGRGRGG